MKTWVALLAGLLGLAAAHDAARAAEPAALPGESVYHLRARLTDSSGRSLEFRDLRGKPRVATMFYASCRYACPLVIDSLRSIERQLAPAERERLGFVLITMDPGRDTPEALAKVLQERRLDAARWRLLRPMPEDLRGIAGVLGIRYRSLADGEFNHTNGLVLLDAEGRVLSRSDRLGADAEFVAAVRDAARSAGPPDAPLTRGRGRP